MKQHDFLNPRLKNEHIMWISAAGRRWMSGQMCLLS